MLFLMKSGKNIKQLLNLKLLNQLFAKGIILIGILQEILKYNLQMCANVYL